MMWKEYSTSYLKHNRASGRSIMAAVFVAALLLSLLHSHAYNLWRDEINRITAKEGDWQGRITGRITEQELSVIRNFANVEHAGVNEELSEGAEKTVDIYFKNRRRIFQDMPLIAEELRISEEHMSYHLELLSRYLVHDPQDFTPPLLMSFYLAVLVIVSVSLILIIRNSFELTMQARIHQFGILSSIGAAPRQIRACLLQEAAVLSVLPMLFGSMLGIAVSCGVVQAAKLYIGNVSEKTETVFCYHPLVIVITILSAGAVVLFSAWLPARKLSKMTPLEAIRNAGGIPLCRQKHSPVLSVLFGIEGELAGNALKARRKSMRIASWSLMLSFLGFSVMLCFVTLSDISTRYTYFERYQYAWDVMASVKDTPIEDFRMTEELQELSGVQDVIVYQKAEEMCLIPEAEQSKELASLGGLGTVTESVSIDKNGRFQVKAPIVIMDDASFLNYCVRTGNTADVNGALVYNQVWDSLHSNFREREYLPFVQETRRTSILYGRGQEEKTLEIPVLAYVQELPVLREEYEDYALVHFVSLSMWKGMKESLGEAEPDSYVRILSDGSKSLTDLNRLEKTALDYMRAEYEVQSENRIQEKMDNARMIQGMKVIMGGFCVLLALIGIANVFSNTLGFLRQRKREFAMYMSVGLTPSSMRKIFCIEAFVTAGRPILITLPLTAAFIQFAAAASFLEPEIFWREAPVVPVLVFAAVIAGFAALAYYIGGKRLLQCDLNEALRNDTMI